jgi:hypothetical protein
MTSLKERTKHKENTTPTKLLSILTTALHIQPMPSKANKLFDQSYILELT